MNLKALISQFGLPLEFLSRLYSMNGHISGSIVLQCMTGDFFPESDLDVFAKTPEDVVMLAEYFTRNGYTLVSAEGTGIVFNDDTRRLALTGVTIPRFSSYGNSNMVNGLVKLRRDSTHSKHVDIILTEYILDFDMNLLKQLYSGQDEHGAQLWCFNKYAIAEILTKQVTYDCFEPLSELMDFARDRKGTCLINCINAFLKTVALRVTKYEARGYVVTFDKRECFVRSYLGKYVDNTNIESFLARIPRG